jgi:hypothetical protein
MSCRSDSAKRPGATTGNKNAFTLKHGQVWLPFWRSGDPGQGIKQEGRQDTVVLWASDYQAIMVLKQVSEIGRLIRQTITLFNGLLIKR